MRAKKKSVGVSHGVDEERRSDRLQPCVFHFTTLWRIFTISTLKRIIDGFSCTWSSVTCICLINHAPLHPIGNSTSSWRVGRTNLYSVLHSKWGYWSSFFFSPSENPIFPQNQSSPCSSALHRGNSLPRPFDLHQPPAIRQLASSSPRNTIHFFFRLLRSSSTVLERCHDLVRRCDHGILSRAYNAAVVFFFLPSETFFCDWNGVAGGTAPFTTLGFEILVVLC